MLDLGGVEVGQPRQAELERKRLEQLIFFDGAQADQQFTEAAALGLLQVQRLQQLRFRHPELAFQDAPQQRGPV